MTTKRKNNFDLFRDKAEEVADGWDNPEVAYEAPVINPGSREMFEWMADEMYQRITALDALSKFRKGGVQHGMLVMSRIIYMYALVAKAEAMTVKEFHEALMENGSYEAFEPIAMNMSDRVATRVEHWLQVYSIRFGSDDELMRRNYAISQSGFQIPTLKKVEQTHKLDIIREVLASGSGREDFIRETEGQCKAHRAGVLKPIYSSMCKVAIKDSRLASAMLKKK